MPFQSDCRVCEYDLAMRDQDPMQSFYQRHRPVKPAKGRFWSRGEARLFLISYFFMCLGFGSIATWMMFEGDDLNLHVSRRTINLIIPIAFLMIIAITIFRYVGNRPKASTRQIIADATETADWPNWIKNTYYAVWVVGVLWFSGAAISLTR